jgi:hypothetical protein
MSKRQRWRKRECSVERICPSCGCNFFAYNTVQECPLLKCIRCWWYDAKLMSKEMWAEARRIRGV